MTKRKRRKKNKITVKDMDEFRKLNTKEAKGHLHYVCGKKGKKYQSVGTTHARRTNGKLNIPLENNPNPQDKRKAYVRPELTEEEIEKYGKRLSGLRLSQNDRKVIWELIGRERKKPDNN